MWGTGKEFFYSQISLCCCSGRLLCIVFSFINPLVVFSSVVILALVSNVTVCILLPQSQFTIRFSFFGYIVFAMYPDSVHLDA